MKLTSYKKGILSEYLACTFLIIKGYSILDTRFKTKLGEIDIIAKKKKSIHFIEVKMRDSLDNAKYAITDKNKYRVTNSAKLFIQKNQKYSNYDLHFDAITVNSIFSLQLIKNAW